jgi:hypothetical protein
LIIDSPELERLVRETFPQKRRFSAAADLRLSRSRPAVAFVHGGGDPFLDRQLDDWLAGAATFVAVYPLLNRLPTVLQTAFSALITSSRSASIVSKSFSL